MLSNVWCVLLYGCETWTTNGQDKKKLEANVDVEKIVENQLDRKEKSRRSIKPSGEGK